MAAKVAKVQIDRRRIQKRRQAFCQLASNALAVCMEVIQMILKPDRIAVDLGGIKYTSNYSSSLLFSCEPFYEHVISARY